MGINYFEHNLVLNISFNVKIQYLFELIIYHLFVFHIFTVSTALTGRSQVRISAEISAMLMVLVAFLRPPSKSWDSSPNRSNCFLPDASFTLAPCHRCSTAWDTGSVVQWTIRTAGTMLGDSRSSQGRTAKKRWWPWQKSKVDLPARM
jgi:hypothetical protein